MDDAAKLQKEKEYKQYKIIVRKLVKRSKMQHYHKAVKKARTNPIEMWNLLKQLVNAEIQSKITVISRTPH